MGFSRTTEAILCRRLLLGCGVYLLFPNLDTPVYPFPPYVQTLEEREHSPFPRKLLEMRREFLKGGETDSGVQAVWPWWVEKISGLPGLGA